MKLWKRICSVVLVIALVVTGLQYGGITAQAETSYTDMKISGYLNSNTNYGHWRVNLSTSAVLPTSGASDQYFTGLTIESDLPLSGPQVYRAGDKILMLILWGSGTTAVDGDTITLKAGSGVNSTDATKGINITQDYTLVYNGTTNTWQPKVDYTEIPITGNDTPEFYKDSYWRVNLNTSATLPVEGVYRGVTVELNGEAISAYGYKNESDLLLVMEGWKDSEVADGTTLTLKNGYAVSANNPCVGIYIPNQYSLVFDADANGGEGAWIVTKYAEINIKDCTYSFVSGNSHWRVNLSTSDTLPTSSAPEQYFKGLTVESDLEIGLLQVLRAADQTLMLILWGSGTTAEDGDKIVVKAGFAMNTTDATLGIHITQDYTLVYNGTTNTWQSKVDYTEIPITGNDTPEFYKDSYWRVNLNTSATLPVEGVYRGVTVELNGEAISAYGYKNESDLLLVMEGWKDSEVADGTTLTLKNGYAVSANNPCVGIYIPNQYSLVFDADANGGAGEWIVTEYAEINIKDYLNSNTNSGHWRVNIETSDKIPTSDTASPYFDGLTIESDLAISLPQVYRAGDKIMMLILWGSGTTAQDGDTIVVKAGFAMNTSDPTLGIHITKDFKLVYNASIGSWEAYFETDYADITAENLSSTSWYTTAGGSKHWRLYANVSGTFPSTDSTTGYYSAPVQLNGETNEKTSGAQVYKSGSTIGLLLWNYQIEKPEDGTTITVPIGKYRDTGDVTVGINITEDINFVWDADANEWYLDIVPEESNTFALDILYKNGGDGKHIYLTSNDEREAVGDSANITAVKTGIVSGIFYNGEATKGYLRMTQYGEDSTIYCVMLGDVGIDAVRGDLVTVQGCFGYNNYVVNYEPITLLYDGTQWHTCNVVYQKEDVNGSLAFQTSDADGKVVQDPLAVGSYTFEQGGYYKNDDLLEETEIRKTSADSNYVAQLSGSWALDSKAVLDGIILDKDHRTAVKFMRATWIKNGENEWNIVENEYYDKTVSLTVDTEFSSVNDDTVTIVMQPSKGILGELGTATWKGLYITATDSDGAITYLGQPTMTKTDRGMLQFSLDKTALPSGKYTITVKMGLLSPVDTGLETEKTIYPVYNMKDSYIYVNDYGIGYRKHVVRGNSGEADEALTLDSANSTATAVKWTVATTSLTSNVAMSATDIDSGVFINGKRYEDATVTKTADTTLQVNLSGVYTPVSGDHLLVVGTFACEEEFIVIAPAAATYDGSSWSTTAKNCTTNITLNIYDDEYVIEGTNVVVKDDKGAKVNKKVLYQAGNYTVTRTIGDVIFTYNVSLYRPNDLNQNNTYDAVDLVKRLKCEKTQGYKDTLPKAGRLAAEEGSVADVRSFILGRTKADATLPTDMIGETTNTGTDQYTTYSKYITAVSGTTNGTTVIGMSDANADYEPKTNKYDDYGFDYVLDFDVADDRELRILQLTDTQIIDATQERYSSRLGQSQEALWDGTAEVRQRILFDCIEATVAKAQPDLILISGDIIFGEFDDNGENLKALVAHMEQYKIPWAPVYGNHDNESYMGVAWQNAQFADATYCLYYSGHDIGGNSNYSIGLAKNGTLQRTVYMMDTNFCSHLEVYEGGVLQTGVKHINQDGDKSNGEILTQRGFTDAQHEWYRTTALRTNAIVGDTIPSMLCYHVPTFEVWLGAKAACYQEGYEDKNTIQYTIGVDNIAQSGDSGFKLGYMISPDYSYKDTGLLDIMLEVGGDSASFGHEHISSVSLSYGGVRWTFGLKTGAYDTSPTEQGGTLFTISADGSSIDVKQIVVTGTTTE